MDQPPAPRRSDGLRFAFGTLTVLPVPVPRWDRAAARGGMACAPLVGAVVGALAGAGGALITTLGGPALLAAVTAVAVPAVLTRGLHLDGLADTADGLGSGQPPARALDIMKQSDIGPFGVLTLVLVLLAQVASLSACYAYGWRYGAAAAVAAGLLGRAALTLASRTGVPPARPEGLGAAVSGVLPRGPAYLIALTCALLTLPLGWAFHGLAWLRFLTSSCLSLLLAELLLRRCVVRFRGVTGDVFGALCETATTSALFVLALR